MIQFRWIYGLNRRRRPWKVKGKYRESDPGEKFQQGLFAGVIVVSLIATLMAADRVAQMYGYVN